MIDKFVSVKIVLIAVVVIELCFGQSQEENLIVKRSPQFERRQFGQQQQQQQFQNQNFQHQQQQQFQQQSFQRQQPFQQQQSFQQHQQHQPHQFEQLQAFEGSGVTCPENNGRFIVQGQCDAYIECVDGVGEEKLCPEGLYFNPDARFNYPCGYPIDIKCDGRPGLQPAQPTDDCPHQYGYFKLGDATNCGKFMNCAAGVGYEFDCPEGLAFSSESYRCDWPDQVPDCDVEAFLKFSCPPVDENTNLFALSETRFFRNPTDCQRYFICVNGRPRLQNCGEGNAFNELINACDAAENVTTCGQQDLQGFARFGNPQAAPQQGFNQRGRIRLF